MARTHICIRWEQSKTAGHRTVSLHRRCTTRWLEQVNTVFASSSFAPRGVVGAKIFSKMFNSPIDVHLSPPPKHGYDYNSTMNIVHGAMCEPRVESLRRGYQRQFTRECREALDKCAPELRTNFKGEEIRGLFFGKLNDGEPRYWRGCSW